MELFCLSPTKIVPEHQVQRMLDQIMEAGIPPTPDGRCQKKNCNGRVAHRRNTAEAGYYYLLSPWCIRCGTRYRLVSPDAQLFIE